LWEFGNRISAGITSDKSEVEFTMESFVVGIMSQVVEGGWSSFDEDLLDSGGGGQWADWILLTDESGDKHVLI